MLRSAAKTFFACCASMALVACTMVSAGTASQSHAVNDGDEYTLRPGEQAGFSDLGALRYQRLVNDSRCAPDVQCIWAGDAEVAFEWMPERGAKQSFSLHTGVEPRSHILGTRRLTLVSLARGAAPAATVRVDPAATP
jgi:hypothetical protein